MEIDKYRCLFTLSYAQNTSERWWQRAEGQAAKLHTETSLFFKNNIFNHVISTFPFASRFSSDCSMYLYASGLLDKSVIFNPLGGERSKLHKPTKRLNQASSTLNQKLRRKPSGFSLMLCFRYPQRQVKNRLNLIPMNNKDAFNIKHECLSAVWWPRQDWRH